MMTELRTGVFPAPMDDPHADERTQPFWDAALQGKLIAPRCTNCGTFILPPAPICFNCQHDEFEWIELPGTGTVYSFTVVRHPLRPQLAQVVPFVSAVVELDGTQGAGSRMLANIIDCDPETIKVGDKVRVTFDKVSESYAVPRFEPA